mgnify:CR=1 FL=1
MKPTFRRATRADAGAATAVIAAAYAPWRIKLPDLPDVTADVASEIEHGIAWVAELGGRIVGVVIARRTEAAVHIANLAVAPDAGGHGIGSALVRTVEDAAHQDGVSVLQLATHARMDRNVTFYERLGWKVSSQQGNKILMERRLPSRGEAS